MKIDRHELEELGYQIRDIADVVSLIEISAADGDKDHVAFRRGIEKTSMIVGTRLNDIARRLVDMNEQRIIPFREAAE